VGHDSEWLAERLLTLPRQVVPSSSRINRSMKKSISFKTSETSRNDKTSRLRRLEYSEITVREPEIWPINIDLKFTLEQATKTQRGVEV
jgi:hypothetical protein